MSQTISKHPAKYSDIFIPVFAKILSKYDCHKILDPFAGIGKITEIKNYGFSGQIYANEIEPDWAKQIVNCDTITICDAEYLEYPSGYFDAIVTSPTYGNRMADHHKAKDGSKRNTYTHCIGHQLKDGNTGKMQFGKEYQHKHEQIYANICKMVKNNGLFILNVSNFIKNGAEVDVVNFHRTNIEANNFLLVEDIKMSTHRNRYGRNGNIRVDYEHIMVFIKGEIK